MSKNSCVVVDYGIGNVFSVMKSLSRCGAEPMLTGNPAVITAADRVILPGVGAFGRASERLRALGLDDAIREYVNTERPFLGICVGMQLMLDVGYEFGEHKGLGLVQGEVRKIENMTDTGEDVRIPLIGWYRPETLPQLVSVSPFDALEPEDAFYFVHSYAANVQDPSHRVAIIDIEGRDVTAAIRRDNIWGVQFHPERSAMAGQRFLQGFLSL